MARPKDFPEKKFVPNSSVAFMDVKDQYDPGEDDDKKKKKKKKKKKSSKGNPFAKKKGKDEVDYD